MGRTVTWTTLRRDLSRNLREPFFRRLGAYRPITASAANYLMDTALGRFSVSEGWPYAFAYVPRYGDQREITNFLSDGTLGYAYVSPNFSTTPSAGMDYEIHSIWSAQEKLDAINQARQDCWPAFYEIGIDENIIIQKWKKEYSLSNFAHNPRHILGVYLEPIWKVDQSIGGSIAVDSIETITTPGLVGFTSTTLITTKSYVPDGTYGRYEFVTQAGAFSTSSWVIGDTTVTYTIDSGDLTGSITLLIFGGDVFRVTTTGKDWTFETGKTYEMAIYYGTGAGHTATITSTGSSAGGFNVAGMPDFTMDATSEFAVKNVSDESYNWQGPLTRYRLDSSETPTIMALHWDSTEYWGARVRVIYAYEIERLTAEASTVPDQAAEYLLHRAAYYLWLSQIGRGPQFETKTAEKMAQQSMTDAEQARARNRMKPLNGQIRLELDNYGPAMREKPFTR